MMREDSRKVLSIFLVALMTLAMIPLLTAQVSGATDASIYECSGAEPSEELGSFDEKLELTADTPTGSSYMLYDHHGGWWCDAEKTKDNDDDDLMCWAAAATNVLEWTGWGMTSGKWNTDEMFQYSLNYWDDRTGWMTSAWQWWFDGTLADVPGGGNFWSGHTWTDYLHEEYDPALALQAIDDYLHAGYGVAIGIWDGGHVITCWGFQYDGSFDKTTQPGDYYLGVWVTDSDDDKGWTGPAVDAPNSLRYLPVNWNGTHWNLVEGYGGWHISGVGAFEPFPNNNRPMANAGGPYTGHEGSLITFDGSDSSDPDGDSLMYRWDFDNDGLWDTGWSSSPEASHTWSDDYTGTVVLEVRDSRSAGALMDGTITSVTVNNVAPSIDDLVMTPPNQDNPEFILPTVHEPLFRAPTTDPGSDDLTFIWDWDDGTDDTTIYYNDGVGPDPYPSPWGTYPFSATEQIGHIYSEPGTYTVALTVEDDDEGVDTATYEITILSAEEAKHVINDYIQGLPDDAFKNNPDQRKKAFNNMFSAIDDMLDDEEYIGAIHHLRHNIREKTDGFVGGSSKNDWITDATAQEHICWKIDALIAYLETLI